MPSEDRIRAEVRRMAEAIEVDTDAHLATVLGRPRRRRRGSEPTGVVGMRRRRWVPLAAAASVAAVVAGAVAVTGSVGEGGGPVDRASPAVLAGAPDGTVPSVFGHTRESAGELLRARGLEVRYGRQVGCDPAGRPVGTEPTTGTPVAPGDTVTVLLSYQGATTDCVADLREPWRFVDLATGRGPGPRFTADVALFVDGERTGSLSAADAARGAWGEGSALDVVARATEQVLRAGDTYRTPGLQVTTGTPPDSWCGVARPRAVADREALTLTIDFELDGATAAPRCPARVALYETDGAIDTVVAWSDGARGAVAAAVPDVVGLPLDAARDRVTAAGYPARTEEVETCRPRDGVVEQAPTQQAVEQDRADDPGWSGPVTLVVEVPHRTRDCAALDAAADGFLRFARGGAPPAWAPEVQQLLGYTPWDTVTAEEADDRTAWSFCPGVAPDECAVSALRVAGVAPAVDTGEYADVARLPDDVFCELVDRGGLPSGLPEDRLIVLYPEAVSSCDDDWSVWLWIDETGRIATVNLLVPASVAAEEAPGS